MSIPPSRGSDFKNIWQSLLDRAVQAPFKAVSLSAFLLGGLIMLIHFNSARYLPDINLENATSVILGVAVLGGVLILLLAVTMIIPCVLLRIEAWNPHFLHYRKTPNGLRIRVSARTELQRRIIFVVLNFLHGIMAFAVVLTSFTFLLEPADQEYGATLRFSMCIGGSVAAVLLLLLHYRVKKSEAQTVQQTGRALAPRIPHWILFFIWLTTFASFMGILVLAASGLKKADLPGHLNLLYCTVAYIVVNPWLACVDLRTTRNYWLFPAGAAFLMAAYLWLPANPFSVTRSVVSSLALGSAGSTRFVVKQPTCDALNLLVTRACLSRSTTVGCVSPDRMSTRIGSDYVLEFEIKEKESAIKETTPRGGSAPKVVRLIVPKSEVLAWSIVDARQSGREPCLAPDQQDASVKRGLE